MMRIDYGGIATLIGAVGGFLTVCVSLVLQILNFRKSTRRDVKLEEVHREVQEIKKGP